MLKLHKSEGFSLVELMIVVAIMAILAAIAIPTYLNFQMKARESEARTNLAAIKTCEESYKAESDVYVVCDAHPAAAAAFPGSKPVDWTPDGANFDLIGFNPSGGVRYQYAVAAGTNGITTSFSATAAGDLDDDNINAGFTVTESTSVIKDLASAGEY